jgi:putative spermidine/putrescine transport system ATP-binding protein/spermidine/putrescine transport system ATP-binding protein
MVRPHNLTLAPLKLASTASPAGGGWRGELKHRRHVGPMMEYEIGFGDGGTVKAVALHGDLAAEPAPGDAVAVTVRDPARCMVFPA